MAVGGEKRGIIASASYEARAFGVYTPMPTVQARKLCPQLVVLPGDFERYEQFSNWMFGYCYDFTPAVEQTSIDEGYFDLTANRSASPSVIAGTIRKAIGQRLKITVSQGIGASKLVSAVASKLTKPAAFNEIAPGQETAFLHPLPNKWLPGIGPHASDRLNSAGLVLIRHVAATPLEWLERLLGRPAALIRQFALGIDERPLIPARAPQKTFSQQTTFSEDVTREDFAEATLRHQADHLFASVREEGRAVRTLTVKIRYNDREEDQAAESLLEPTDLETEIYGRLHALLRKAWKRRVSLRMVALKLSNVYDAPPALDLPFEQTALRSAARTRLAVAVDALRQQHGHRILLRGHDFLLRPLEAERPVRPPRRSVARVRRDPPPPAPRGVRPSMLPRRAAPPVYIPLRVRSHYSFLDSTLSPSDIVAWAQRHQLPAIGLADLGNLHGAVEFVQAAAQAGIKPILGVEWRVDHQPLLLCAESARGYHHLCRLLSAQAESASSRDESAVAARQRASVSSSFFHRHAGQLEGLVALGAQAELAPLFPGRFYCFASSREAAAGLPAAAAPSVHYAAPGQRRHYDIVQSIRTLTLLEQPHPEKHRGGRRHFRDPETLRAACAGHPEWLRHTLEIAERCRFDFPFGPPQFPDFHPPDGSSPRAFLQDRVMEGLRQRYGSRASRHAAQAREELAIIAAVGYESYFLMVWDLLRECRARGIEWITRGSAADSLVCYSLGISGVCPLRFDLYFKRFLNPERMALHKLPDIDIDFAHDRKDDVVRLIFQRHGPDHCAVVGGFSTFQARSAFGEAAKVLGVSERDVRKFTEHFPWGFGGGWVPEGPAPTGGSGLIELLRASPVTRDLPLDEEPYKTALEMAGLLDSAPRYPKMHPCGVVLSRQPMRELTPTFISNKGLPTTHYDMDAVEALGLVKMDILAQGGLAVMRDALLSMGREPAGSRLRDVSPPVLHEDPGAWDPDPAHAPPIWCATDLFRRLPATFDDSRVWDMIAGGGARAVHHIESPAMTSLCRMTRVREIDGLIAIVSVIRPGAANESKKLSFTRRYQGFEPVTYPHSSLEPCLRSTYGLVVYEEHILQISEAFAGLSAGRADVLRRALVKQKRAVVEEIGREFIASARARGHDEAKIAEVWELVTGFSGYAFNKAHSTAYGVEAYQAAWLKLYHPAEFMAGVLTHGKGFYHPLVYVLECHRLGIRLLPPSVNAPGPGFAVEPAPRFPPGHSGPDRGAHAASDRADRETPGAQARRAGMISPGRGPRLRYGSRAIRVPLTRMKGLTQATTDALLDARQKRPFDSIEDFIRRTRPARDEIESMIRAGAFDAWGEPRTRQFWRVQAPETVRHLRAPRFGAGDDAALEFDFEPASRSHWPPRDDAQEPSRQQRLLWETELFGFAVTGHPLELFPEVAWETYCPVQRLGRHAGEIVTACGLVVEQRTHHQITGEPMKFLSLADWTGIVETELFAQTYKSCGLATVRYPVLEVEARVEAFENGHGFTLRVLRAGPPRQRK